MAKVYEYETFGERSKFYFRGFPYIEYDILVNGEKNVIKNFFKRFDIREKIKSYGSIYTKWIVKDDDTPHIIAHKLYDSTHYYWLVLMMNSMINPNFDFPMNTLELNGYIDKKYGIENRRAFHHWESVDTGAVADLPDGIIVDINYAHKIDIDNTEYELKINDTKRHILLLKPEYLEQVLNELETILTSDFTKVI